MENEESLSNGRQATDGPEPESTGTTRAGFLKRAAVSGVAAVGASSVIAACGGSDTSAAESTAADSKAPSGGGKIAEKYKNLTIGVPIYTLLDENQATLVKYFKEASESAGLNWKFLTDDTKANQAAAQTAVQSYVTRKVDAILDVVVPVAFIEPQLAAAKTAGIPTIGTFTFADYSPSILADYAAVLDHDAVLMGHYLINDQINNHKRASVEVGMLDSPLGVLAPRRWAFEGIATNTKGVKIVAKDFDISLTDTVTDAAKRATAMLQKNPNLSCLWCNYPPIAVPVASAVQQAGRGDVQVYGHVAQSAGVDAVRSKDNPLVATTWFDFAYNAYGLIGLVLEAVSGGTPNRQVSYLQPVPDIVFGQSNVGSEVPKGTQAADWKFAGGSYRDQFVANWNQLYSK